MVLAADRQNGLALFQRLDLLHQIGARV
jgi:hypothetical protein